VNFSHVQYYEGSDSCFPSPRDTGLPIYFDSSSCRSVSNHVMPPHIALSVTSAYAAISGLRHFSAGSPEHPAESSSSSYGPTFHLGLLPTPLHSDAVAFDYGVVTSSDRDFHPADEPPSWAHTEPLRGKTSSPLHHL